MKSMCFIKLSLSFLVSVTSIYGIFNEKYCKESIFYKPYARFYTEKDGKLIFEVTNGFQSFQTEESLYMCINGPALFYENTTPTLAPERLFDEARLGIYVHQCGYINSDLTSIPPKNGKSRGTIISTTQVNGNGCETKNNNGTITVLGLPPAPNFRIRIWGIFMLGNSSDYRLPGVNLFYDKTFQTRTDLVYLLDLSKPPLRTITEAHGLSIVTIGSITHCLSVPGKSFELTLGNLKEPGPGICFRAQQVGDIYFSNLTTYRSAVLSFAEGNANPMKCKANEELSIPDCFPLPNFTVECEKNKPETDLLCTMTRIALNFDTPTIENTKLQWHTETINLLSDVFEKACPFVSKDFLEIMKTMIYYSVNEAEKLPANPNVPKPAEIKRWSWDFLHASLKECGNKVKPLKFKNLTFQSTYHYKRNLIFINETSDGDKPVRLYYFQEQADREFQSFNHMIEMQWIIFATVLGICPSYYNTKTASVSSRLYTYFTEDFLFPLTPLWVDSTHNQYYEFVFKKLLNEEIHTKALSCLEASYIQSNTVSYRYQRPIVLDCYQTANAFIDLPIPDYFTSKPTDKPKQHMYYVPPF